MRDLLERYQVWIYLVTLALGLLFGSAFPQAAPVLEWLVWPALVALLYATFALIPLDQLPDALRDRRFLSAVTLGNFVLLPLVVWGAIQFLPDDPAIRLGALLVLLVPCTDWFITFTHQAGGDAHRAVVITPVMLLLQIVLLPLYLWVFMGDGFGDVISGGEMLRVFVLLIVVPMGAAWLTNRWAHERPQRAEKVARLGFAPVPLLAFVLFCVAASLLETVRANFDLVDEVVLTFGLFIVGGIACALLLAKLYRLPVAQARTLLFSLTTRNSFVVLPFALALSPQWQAAAIVIVVQSMVELLAMLLLLTIVPRYLFPRV